MSDPRNVAHAKKVTQEKKHQGTEARSEETAPVQPGRKPAAAKKKHGPPGAEAAPGETVAGESVVLPTESTPKPPAELEGSLAVLGKLKEIEFHSRATLERLAALVLTVEDELKQKAIAAPLGEVYAAQNAFQTKLTTLIEVYKAECDRLQS